MKTGMKLCGIFLGLLLCWSAEAMQVHRSFNEVASLADFVVVGTVSEMKCHPSDTGKMIFTDVTFSDLKVVYAKKGSLKPEQTTLTLSFAGGEFNGQAVEVSDVPKFEALKRYVLFGEDKETPVACQIAGGVQGLFRVEKDSASEEVYPLTYGGRGVASVAGDGELSTSPPVEGISSGKASFRKSETTGRFEVLPVLSSNSPSKNAKASISKIGEPQTDKLMTLSEFIKEVQTRVDLKKGEIR